MPKKKGNLKAALQGHFVAQDQKARQRAAEEAAHRKALSVAKSNPSRSNAKRKHALSKSLKSTISPDDHEQDNSSSRPTIQPRQPNRFRQPFQKDDTILIVGEANFSFTLSLLLPPRSHPPFNILATAYDSEKECFEKYPDAKQNVQSIRKIAGRDDVVLFGVDAGQLEKHKRITGSSSKKSSASKNIVAQGYDDEVRQDLGTEKRRWSKVWFGFPHVGAGHKDETRNVLANQLLILRFLISVAPLLTVGTLPGYAPGGSSGKKHAAGSDDEQDDLDNDDAEQVALGEPLTASNLNDADQTIMNDTQARISALEPFSPPNRQGSVLITLRNASPYTLWDVANLAKRLPQMLPVIASTAPALPKGVKKPTLKDLTNNGLSTLSPANLHSKTTVQRKQSIIFKNVHRYRSYHLWRSFEFDPNEWRGYQHRRTIGWIEGVSIGANQDLLKSRNIEKVAAEAENVRASKAGGGECRTWEFGLS
ncbi:uncharacterized protein MEPE_03441 [Melanopsichium pennsylvanicum]|uniref:25S rRNA (uridine-N(3))-methyltransferase BMT5-like domain-containing protein n=2 Tax=Melanopsichium pennsylvanicum TaxID=63383 RepID=A0AAJ4XMU1_9BASI|nr:conserved hypothetical protein [Melanopsichium pennsylvanicum 4]SNX84732.1 uncharacterized protein MEPE_03441 [Melanopsichium pennsylvanicum]